MKYVKIYDWSKLSYRDVQNQLASLRSQKQGCKQNTQHRLNPTAYCITCYLHI